MLLKTCSAGTFSLPATRLWSSAKAGFSCCCPLRRLRVRVRLRPCVARGVRGVRAEPRGCDRHEDEECRRRAEACACVLVHPFRLLQISCFRKKGLKACGQLNDASACGKVNRAEVKSRRAKTKKKG